MERTGAFDFLPKREAIRLRHEKEKLERNLGGMQSLERLPDAIFVIDTKKEHIAVNEARNSASRSSRSWTRTAIRTRWTS